MNLLILLNAASAQEETFDAHGLTIVSEDGDLRDGLITLRAENLSEKRGSLGLLVEYADENLIEHIDDADGLTETPLLDDLLAAHLRGSLYFGDRIGIGLVLPVVVSSEGITGAGGFGIGDARLSAPIGLVLPGEDGTGFGLSMVPYADLPIGDDARFLGDAGVSGGGMLAAGVGLSRLQLNSNIGLDFSPTTTVDSWTGGTGLIAGAGASLLVSEGFALGLETQARPLLTASSVSGTHLPVETVISARGRLESGLHWSVGGAVPLSAGATAAQFRTFAGLGMSFGIDPGGTLNIQVVDDDGQPLPNATVQTSKGTLTTDSSGHALLGSNRTGTEVTIMASLSGYDSDNTSVVLEAGENTTLLTLDPLSSSINLSVRSSGGDPINATVSLVGPEAPSPTAIGDDGAELLEVHHGAWTMNLTADGYDAASRELSLVPGEESPIEVIMSESAVAVVETPDPVVETPDPIVIPDRVVTPDSVDTGSLNLPTVYFVYNEFTLTQQGRNQLRALARQLKANPDLALNIHGHTDVRGSENFNHDLGQLRANKVLDYLADQGVDYRRLSALSYGEAQVADSGQADSAHTANRRVTFSIKR